MDTIHQVVDGKVLNQVIVLPKQMQNILVEIIVRPAAVKATHRPKLSRSELRALLSGSHTEALSGAIKTNTNMTLEEYRAERRRKYECAN